MSNIGILSTKENNSYLLRELRSDHAGEMGAVYMVLFMQRLQLLRHLWSNTTRLKLTIYV